MLGKQVPSLFAVYYMNRQKVFETRMLLDNKLKTAGSEESQSGSTKDASLSTEAELNPPLLAKLRAKLEGNISHERQEKVIDTLEYVNTNSRMLSNIMKHCKTPEVGAELSEGDLTYVGDVSLELINEEEIRGIMAIMSGTFDGILIPDAGNLDIGRMMQSFIGDGAAFKLKGKYGEETTPLYAKIPLDGEEMFESRYTIDDLLIGKVGVVGICKGKILPAELKSPLDYFRQSSGPGHGPQNDVVVCNENLAASSTAGNNRPKDEGYYIDILAVIQAVSFEAR